MVANSKWDDARSDITPFLYLPYSQDKNLGRLAFYIRTERDPSPMAAALRSLAQRLDPNLPVNNLRTLEEQVSNSMSNDRLVAVLSVSLALLAALLAALGLYGVLAYVVARRTREIGIRLALGGERADIFRLVVGQGGRLTVVGGSIGIVAAVVAMRWVASLLYGVTAHDPLTCRCRRATRDCLGRSLLHPRAEGDARRSDGYFAIRVTRPNVPIHDPFSTRPQP